MSAVGDWLDMASFRVVNDRGVPTFERPQGRSVIDLCLVPSDSSREFVRCSVDTVNCSFSDHNYIYWDIAKPHSRESFTKCAVKGWSFDKIDKDKFKRSFSLSSAFDEAGQAVLSADQLVRRVTDDISSACDASMPRIRIPIIEGEYLLVDG
ncbi:hypothetical protein P5V15_013859 [Pogonomyrmex californicus]